MPLPKAIAIPQTSIIKRARLLVCTRCESANKYWYFRWDTDCHNYTKCPPISGDHRRGLIHSYLQPAYLQVLLCELYDAHPALVVQDLILGQDEGNAIVLPHHHAPSPGRYPGGTPAPSAVNWLLRVSL